jgi:general secretion pathway protein G
MELIAVVTIVGIVAATALSRFSREADNAREKTCHVNKYNIEIQAQLWNRNRGTMPAADMGSMGADTNYFPDGLPKCPVDKTDYKIDTSGRIVGHKH